MKQHHRWIQVVIWGALISAPLSAQGAAVKRKAAVLPADVPAEEPLAAPVARDVSYGQEDVITIRTKLRFTTLIVLPKTEQILDFTCGDQAFWVVNGNGNFAYIKPAKAGAQTNLNLVTASGNVYSFVLSEVSGDPKALPDLKVFVQLKDDGMLAASQGAPRFVPAEQIETYKKELQKIQDEMRQARDNQQFAINQGISRFVSNVRFSYRFEAGKRPFYVRSMYHDDRFTYIQARPEETPTLYEIKDGEPNLVNFDYKDGVYVVGKVLERGYLAIGKKKLSFRSED